MPATRTRAAKPANDAYVVLLAISLAALLIGCIFLYLDMSQYPSQKPPKVTFNPPQPAAPAEPPPGGAAPGAPGAGQ